MEEQQTLTCEAKESDDHQNALNNKIRTTEVASNIVKNKSMAANNCVLALPMNSEEIELVKTDLRIWLSNLKVMVKNKLKELLKESKGILEQIQK